MDTPNSPPHDKSSKDSKSSKVLPTNNQIYLTLPPLLGQMGGGGQKYLGGRGEMMGVGWGLGWDGTGMVN